MQVSNSPGHTASARESGSATPPDKKASIALVSDGAERLLPETPYTHALSKPLSNRSQALHPAELTHLSPPVGLTPVTTAKDIMPEYLGIVHCPKKLSKVKVTRETVGEGRYGKVALAVPKTNPRKPGSLVLTAPLVIKELHSTKKTLKKYQARWQSEITIQQQASPCLPLYDAEASRSGKTQKMLMPFRGNRLMELMEVKKRLTALPVSLVKSLLQQALQQLSHLHANGIIHRDIKPDNCLIDQMGRLSISDYGYASQCQGSPDKATFTGRYGSLCYMAPEVSRREPYSFKADIWSLGVMAYEMMTGEELYLNDKLAEQIIFDPTEYQEFKDTLATERRLDQLSVELIDRMIEEDCSKRMTAEELLNMPFFSVSSIDETSHPMLQSKHRECMRELARLEHLQEQMATGQLPSEVDIESATRETATISDKQKELKQLQHQLDLITLYQERKKRQTELATATTKYRSAVRNLDVSNEALFTAMHEAKSQRDQLQNKLDNVEKEITENRQAFESAKTKPFGTTPAGSLV